MKPLILVTQNTRIKDIGTYNYIKYTYINALNKAGALPVILPVLRDETLFEGLNEYLDRADGVLFTGGVDISPLLYGEDPIREVKELDYKRDAVEKRLMELVVERKMPMLGICRGMQLMNTVFGGTLYQDLHQQLEKANGHVCSSDTAEGYHRIRLTEGKTLHRLFGKDEIFVNSEHHQAVKDPAEGFDITAVARDGVIEAMEWTGKEYWKSVQFHPEAMVDRHPDFLRIFRDFAEACEK